METEKTLKFEKIIRDQIPYGINALIYQELLQGAKTEKEYSKLNDYIQSQKFYELRYGIKSYENAARMFFLCRKKGITVHSSIDLLIAETAIENKLYLLHDDRDYTKIAEVINDLKEY